MNIDLSTSTYGQVRLDSYSVSILPWGAIEPHNYHLPYLTDSLLSHSIAIDAAEKAFKEYGVKSLVLPPVNFGSHNPGQKDLPFCIHTRYETQKNILEDIVAALYRQGMRRLLIINGHGGNSFKNMIRDLDDLFPDFKIASSEWYRMCKASEFFDEPGDHADEVETSVMLHYYPELVLMDKAGAGRAKAFENKQLASGKIWLPRNWSEVSADSGAGNPERASAQKGEAFVRAVLAEYSEFIKDFSDGVKYSHID